LSAVYVRIDTTDAVIERDEEDNEDRWTDAICY
jgi:hypothetical protein